MLLTTSFAVLSALATVAQAQADPRKVSGNVAVHDPTLCKDKNGKYFLFCAFLFTWFSFSWAHDVLNQQIQPLRQELQFAPRRIELHGLSQVRSGPMERRGQMPTQARPTRKSANSVACV